MSSSETKMPQRLGPTDEITFVPAQNLTIDFCPHVSWVIKMGFKEWRYICKFKSLQKPRGGGGGRYETKCTTPENYISQYYILTGNMREMELNEFHFEKWIENDCSQESQGSVLNGKGYRNLLCGTNCLIRNTPSTGFSNGFWGCYR